MSRHRSVCRMTSSRFSRLGSSSRMSSTVRPVSARMPPSGLLTSWATPAASIPSEASLSDCATRACMATSSSVRCLTFSSSVRPHSSRSPRICRRLWSMALKDSASKAISVGESEWHLLVEPAGDDVVGGGHHLADGAGDVANHVVGDADDQEKAAGGDAEEREDHAVADGGVGVLQNSDGEHADDVPGIVANGIVLADVASPSR